MVLILFNPAHPPFFSFSYPKEKGIPTFEGFAGLGRPHFQNAFVVNYCANLPTLQEGCYFALRLLSACAFVFIRMEVLCAG